MAADGGEEKAEDDVLVTIGHPFGDVEVPLSVWMATGPGERTLVRPIRARSASTGRRLPLAVVPLAYRNNGESRRAIREGRIDDPWSESGPGAGGSGERATGTERGRHGTMSENWDPAASGVMRLPSGRLVRGRGLRRPLPPGPAPTYGVYLLGKPPPAVAWQADWIRWPDFRLPTDKEHAATILHRAWSVAEEERVEIACGGGRGRTGTALAIIAVLDGVPPDEAVAYVREHYDRHAVETPWQKRFVSTWRR